MPIYYWKGAEGAEDLLSTHASAIRCILSGEYNPNDLEKLRNSASHIIYSFRLNGTERLLFTTHKGCLHVLEHLPTHDYQKSRFLKKGVLRNYLGHHTAVPEFSELSSEEHKPEFTNTSDSAKALDYYNQQFIHVSLEQTGIIESHRLPLILSGEAGAGKTLVGTLMLARQKSDTRVLYVSKERHLVDRTAESYRSFISEENARSEFKTYDEIIRPFCDDKPFVTQTDINTHCLATEYQEFRICSGFSKEQYIALGERQSSIPQSNRAAFYDRYQQYLRSLESLIDPSFYIISSEPIYDLIVVDEAQNLSLHQLLQLAKLAKNNAIVYCMDPNQNLIDVCASRSLLEVLLHDIGVTSIILSKTYRCSQRVGEALNQVLEFKHQVLGGKVDKREAGAMTVTDDAIRGEFHMMAPDALNMEWIRARAGHLAVITTEDLVEEALARFETPLVFTPKQIQGQEFHTVVVYKLLTQAPKFTLFEKQGTQHRAKKGLGDNTHAPFIANYFTACSRAADTLVIIEHTHKNNKCLLDALQNIISSPVKTKAALPAVDWNKIADEQRAQNNPVIAQRIIETMRPIQKSQKPQKSPTQKATQSPPKPLTQTIIRQFIGAADKGNLDTVRTLQKEYPELHANSTDSSGFTALIQAAQNGHFHIVSYFIEDKRTDPNFAVIRDGRTPLMMATYNNRIDIVRLLLEQPNIDVNKSSTAGSNALVGAATRGYEEIVDMLLAHPDIDADAQTGETATAFMMATQNGHVSILLKLIAHPCVNPNHQDIRGMTSLMIVAAMGKIDIVRLLLNNPKIDPTISTTSTDRAGIFSSALFIAYFQKQFETAKLILNDPRVVLQSTQLMLAQPMIYKQLLNDTPICLVHLIQKKSAIWEILKSPEKLGLTPEMHLQYLREIKQHEHNPDESRRHPLYVILFKKKTTSGLFPQEQLNTIMIEFNQILEQASAQSISGKI